MSGENVMQSLFRKLRSTWPFHSVPQLRSDPEGPSEKLIIPDRVASEDSPRYTTDPANPALTHGIDDSPIQQADVYLVLSSEERAKGYVRPVRRSYQHVGPPGPQNPLRDLTPDEVERYGKYNYIKYEKYPETESSVTGQYWTQDRLDRVEKGCGAVTTMGEALAETYARSPTFYGATYCVHCRVHRPVGQQGEFVWTDDRSRVGT